MRMELKRGRRLLLRLGVRLSQSIHGASKRALDRFADAMIDEIEKMSDEEIVEEIERDGSTAEEVAERTRAILIDATRAFESKRRREMGECPPEEYIDDIEHCDESDDLQKWRLFANAWGFGRRRCSDMREDMDRYLRSVSVPEKTSDFVAIMSMFRAAKLPATPFRGGMPVKVTVRSHPGPPLLESHMQPLEYVRAGRVPMGIVLAHTTLWFDDDGMLREALASQTSRPWMRPEMDEYITWLH